jgi:hypothetical protein
VLAEEDGVAAVADDDCAELGAEFATDDATDDADDDGVADTADVWAVRLDAWAVAPRYPVSPATPTTLMAPVAILARLAG